MNAIKDGKLASQAEIITSAMQKTTVKTTPKAAAKKIDAGETTPAEEAMIRAKEMGDEAAQGEEKFRPVNKIKLVVKTGPRPQRKASVKKPEYAVMELEDGDVEWEV